MEYYIIDKNRLETLLLAEDHLEALKNSGVDNWTWWGDEERYLYEDECDLEEALSENPNKDYMTVYEYIENNFKKYEGIDNEN